MKYTTNDIQEAFREIRINNKEYKELVEQLFIVEKYLIVTLETLELRRRVAELKKADEVL